MSTEPEVGEWDYGAYEGKLTKDIRKEKPNWDIWTDGCAAFFDFTCGDIS